MIITSETLVTIGDSGVKEEQLDFVLQGTSLGTTALRKLIYPTSLLAPLIYHENPDEWTNFDLKPMTARPSIAAVRTLAGNACIGWPGFVKDATVTETWRGSDTEAPMSILFMRALHAYFENPPTIGFIEWHPRDRTSSVYHIAIESFTVGGSEIKLNFIAGLAGFITGDVVLTFRILGEKL